jgi:hypothetical protein
VHGGHELIVIYVSGLNGCCDCHGVRSQTAAAPWMKPALRYLGELARARRELTRRDAEAVFAVSWDEHALHDADRTSAHGKIHRPRIAKSKIKTRSS